MPLIYAGIDEAGYGPLLGPLCVALAAIRVDDWAQGDDAPDLWKHLDKWVTRSPKDAPGRIPVADSKKLKLSNSLKTKHPLTHLELGVMTWLATTGADVRDDEALFAAVGARLESHPWYDAPPTPMPLANDKGVVDIAASRLAACADVGITLTDLRCLAISETAFNAAVRSEGSKAAVTAAAIARLVRDTASAFPEDAELRIVCDRQSGRSDYSGLLERALPGAQIECDLRSDKASHYKIRTEAGPLAVLFQVEAEEAHLPVALASMTAKLVRELAMARFNRYWCARRPELKPTAGYRQDGARWLKDLQGEITPSEQATMVRLA
ncbi:MAG: hypothetical protein AAGI53_05655 [Planctomycetota bacterium]